MRFFFENLKIYIEYFTYNLYIEYINLKNKFARKFFDSCGEFHIRRSRLGMLIAIFLKTIRAIFGSILIDFD